MKRTLVSNTFKQEWQLKWLNVISSTKTSSICYFILCILQKNRQKTGKSPPYAAVKKCILVILRTGWDDNSLLLPALKNPSHELKNVFVPMKVEGHFNPGLFNPKFQPQTFQPQTFQSWSFQPRTFQPQTFQPWTVQPQTSQPRTFQPQVWGWKIRGWKVHVWKVQGWKVWGWNVRGWNVLF